MPLFGNRVVVATANYKHIKEKKKDLFDRETRLGRWVSERRERKEKLKELQVSKLQFFPQNKFSLLLTYIIIIDIFLFLE